jgi:hypothetical protein
MGEGLPTSTFRRIAARRAEHPFAAQFRGISRRTPISRRQNKEEMVLPLTYFFDKKAHKTKWTKEMSDRFKNIEKKIGKGVAVDGGLFGGLFTQLKGGIIPLVGKLGLLTAGVGAAALSFVKVKQAWDTFVEWRKAEEEAKEAEDRARRLTGLGRGTWGEEALKREDPIAAIEQWKKEGRIPPGTAKKIKERIILEHLIPKKTRELKRDVTDVEEITEKIRGGTNQKKELLEAMPTAIKDPFTRVTKEKDAGMLAIQKAVEQVNETLSRQQGSGVRGAALGDPFGVGDPLLIPWSSGQLTVESD